MPTSPTYRNSRRRGYHDANLFMAMTSHKKVSSLDYEYCPKSWTRVGCKIIGQRWTYAIPLEVIYMTPLQTWNPYKLQYKVITCKLLFKRLGILYQCIVLDCNWKYCSL